MAGYDAFNIVVHGTVLVLFEIQQSSTTIVGSEPCLSIIDCLVWVDFPPVIRGR
jgi:hypothetical protein